MGWRERIARLFAPRTRRKRPPRKYDRNMTPGEFIDLIHGMGLGFPLRRCYDPDFRDMIFTQLESGMGPDEIKANYLFVFYGVTRPAGKDAGQGAKGPAAI